MYYLKRLVGKSRQEGIAGMGTGTFSVSTDTRMEFVDITSLVQKEVSKSIRDGVCYIYNPHTTAGLTINE